MADIRLNVSGDASGGTAAMDSMGESVGKSAVKWQEMANAAKFAAQQVGAFLVDSVKKYAESERGMRQLQRAAGDYSDAIAEQSKALSKLYAIDDDIINQSAVLLTQWGGVGAATKNVETAALNLAAAMGGDLKTATADLIRNVESGGVGLAKLGVHFKVTGDKGKDLEAAVNAINVKFGGAAGADADSLIGRTHAAQLAFEDLQKSIGGMLASALDRSGALPALTAGLRGLTDGLERAFSLASAIPGLLGGVLRGNIDPKLALEEAKNALMAPGGAVGKAELPGVLPAVTGKTNKGLKDAPEVLAHEKTSEAHDAIYRHDEEAAAHHFEKLEELRFGYAKVSEEADQAEAKRAAEQAKADAKEMAREEEKALKDMNDRTAKKAKEAQAAGDAIGAAMVNALADQLAKLAEGGEFDVALFVGDIVAAGVGIAASVIGSALGAPAVGAAVGNLLAMGVRAGSSAISAGNRRERSRSNSYHDGGEISHWPRFHSGGGLGPDEVPIIAQTGEHMLSRRDVSRMGGHAGVEAAKRGGGLTLNVTAIDTKSVADTFAGAGADGLKQALRRGQGALPALLSGALAARGPR